MDEENEPGKTGLRAAVTAMLKSRRFLTNLGEDLKKLGLAAAIASAAALFPTTEVWHPVSGVMLLITSVVSYVSGAYLASNGRGAK